MAKLYGAQRMVLQAIQDAQGDTRSFIEDSRVAQATNISLRDMRDWLLTLDQDEYVDLALTEGGMSASVTAKGRLALGLYKPFPTPSGPEPSRSRSKTGRERALVIGVSDYPAPIRKLPGVANDVRDMANLLGSDKGQFPAQNVMRLIDAEATSPKVIAAIENTFANVQPDDSVFAYMAGHGEVVKDSYYFITYNTRIDDIPSSSVPLKAIKDAFDASPSQRAFLWLDFCYSGGIIPRDLTPKQDDETIIRRDLKVVQGQGKLIITACTSTQKAIEQGHGLFTGALLKGLEGEAANKGEVTINSLFDYISRQMESDRQRPMMFGQMTGRVVLMHLS
jgi:Caspase domain